MLLCRPHVGFARLCRSAPPVSGVSVPAQWGELAGAAPRVVGQREVVDGAQLQASGERLQLVVVQVQRSDGRHARECSVGELVGGGGRELLRFQ